MKCWIASFPRSGNTFFRNILYYVYGIESSTWHKETRYPVEKNYEQFDFVKTHLLPDELEPNDESIPAIYLVRDGRDALVSIAHHRSDIVRPGSDFSSNLFEAIIASRGSFFGGWSKNVNAWLNRADVVIKFEELIKDPQKVFQRVEDLVNMPSANWDKLPLFEDLKFGNPQYGGQTTSKEIQIPSGEFSKKFFRKGKSGGWKEDMTSDHLDLFWHFHGDVMERLGYAVSPANIPQNKKMDALAIHKLGIQMKRDQNEMVSEIPVRILIDYNLPKSSEYQKMNRYIIHFLKGLEDAMLMGSTSFQFDVLMENKVISIRDFLMHVKPETSLLKNYRKMFIHFKKAAKSLIPYKGYIAAVRFYKNSGLRTILQWIKKNALRTRKRKLTKELNRTLQQASYNTEHYDIYHIPYPVKDMGSYDVSNANTVLVSPASPSNQVPDSLKTSELNVFAVPLTANKKVFYPPSPGSRTTPILGKYQIDSTPYFLCNAGNNCDKCFQNILHAFSLFKQKKSTRPTRLVIFGDKDSLSNKIPGGLTDVTDIIYTGFVQESDLHSIYSQAIAFIHNPNFSNIETSYLEAMYCKTPTIFCVKNPMPDTFTNIGLTADQEDPADIKKALDLLYSDKSLGKKLATRGFNHSLTFSLRKTVYKTLNVYESLCTK